MPPVDDDEMMRDVPRDLNLADATIPAKPIAVGSDQWIRAQPAPGNAGRGVTARGLFASVP
jgi:hypothetical protein